MNTKLRAALIVLASVASIHQSAGQSTRFFRISGPAATTITAFNPDGTLVWSNALAGTNYTVQTVTALPGGTNWVDYVQIPVTNDVSTNLIVAFNPPAGMVLIPAGVFTMGDTLGDTPDDWAVDNTPTNLYVSAFYMDANLVTYSQWLSVYNWATNNGYGFFEESGGYVASGKTANHPVQMVDWYDAVKWSNARSQQEGLKPAYYTDAALALVYTNGDVDEVYVNWTNNGYRLPTEAEWEKAARGGLSGQRFPWGDTIDESQANYFSDLGYYYEDPSVFYDLGPASYNTNFDDGVNPYTSPVGSFAANGYGLYDMAGNVYEWCWDWLGTPYGQPTTDNPTGPATGVDRVLRGDGWDEPADWARCAARSHEYPSYVGNDTGFRCVRGL